MTTTDPIITGLVTAAMTYAAATCAYDIARHIREKTTGVEDYDKQEAVCDKALDAVYDAAYHLKEAARLCTAEAVRDELVPQMAGTPLPARWSGK